MARKKQEKTQVFRVFVDKTLPFGKMFKAGKYCWVDKYFKTKQFEAKYARISGPSKKAEMVDIELWFPKKIFHNVDEVVTELKKTKPDYRPITLPELLALAIAHPELQLKFPLAALGTIWRCGRYDKDGSRFCVTLDKEYRSKDERSCGMMPVWLVVAPRYCFPLVRLPQKKQ